jgi:putative membrane protein
MRFSVPLRLRLLPSAAALVAACHGSGAPAPSPAAPTARLTDANIAAIVVAANNADIAYARLAVARHGDPQVLAFAQRMLTDHGAVNKAATDLVTRLHVTPEENATSLDIRDNAAFKLDALRELTGTDFDKAYIANEVKYHTDLLNEIDTHLIPGATHPDVKALLASTRPAVAAHLAMAEQIRQALGG